MDRKYLSGLVVNEDGYLTHENIAHIKELHVVGVRLLVKSFDAYWINQNWGPVWAHYCNNALCFNAVVKEK